MTGILALPPRSPNYQNSPQVSYVTQLPALEQAAFMEWVQKNRVPYDPSPYADYDMPGFWKALQAKDPRAVSSINPSDNRMHYPDIWKTPYHRTFSNQSMHSKNPTDPRWEPRPPYQHGGILTQFGKPLFIE